MPKRLLALFLTIFVAFMVLAVSQFQARFPLPASTPTAIPGKGFVMSIPQKALFKNYVNVSVEATPHIPRLFEKIRSMDTVADASGTCSWKWKIDETKGKGMGRLIFTIEGTSETHFIEIRANF